MTPPRQTASGCAPAPVSLIAGVSLVVHDHITRYGEASAQRLLTRAFVATVQRLADLGHLDFGYTPWRQA